MAEREKIAGLPIQKEWVVTAVKEGEEENNPNGAGTLKKFYVDFEGAPDVYWRRKMPATVDVGKSYFGTISEGKHGPIFKKETPGRPAGAPAASSSSSGTGGSRSYKPESEFDPEKVRRIGRAHAQDMAVKSLTAMGTFEGKSGEQIFSKLKEWINWFEKDVDDAAAAAKAAAPAPEAEPEQQPEAAAEGEPVDPTTMRNLCEHAGLTKPDAEALTGFVCNRLTAEQQQRAKVGLERDTTTIRNQLEDAYLKAEGHGLPSTQAATGGDDDIPF